MMILADKQFWDSESAKQRYRVRNVGFGFFYIALQVVDHGNTLVGKEKDRSRPEFL